jgi:vesicular inhibitory amino acid transporter
MTSEQPRTSIQADENAPLAREHEGDVQHRTNLQQTTFNMINCFVGAGILTVPFGFRLAGYGACLCLAVVAGLNWYTALLLGKALDKAALLHPEIPSRNWTMGALARAAFGPTGDRVIRLLFALELWFALETFLVLTGISVNQLTGLPEPLVIIVAGFLGCMSLGLPMTIISSGSLLAVACMVVGLIALMVCGMGRLWDHAAGLEPLANRYHTFEVARTPASLGIFLYCFSGLPCLPNIRAAMQRPREDYEKAINTSMLYAFFYYLAIGVLGYEFFANDTRRSFLKDLAPIPGEGHARIYGYVSACAAGLFALKLQAGFPLYAGPVLEAIGFGKEERLPASQILVARAAFGLVSVSFAIFARNQLDAIAELMGAFLTNATSIMFPVAAYWSLFRARGEKPSKGHAFGLSALMIFGAVYCIIGTYSAVSNLLYGRSISLGNTVEGYGPAKSPLMRSN